jgi:hypothetical protein
MPNIHLEDFEFMRMWPRELMRKKDSKGRLLIRPLVAELERRGVYILYKDEEPYYVGRATRTLWIRLHSHSNRATDRYYAHWNYFSVFVLSQDVKDYKRKLVELEAILIAALPRAVNHSTPRFTPIVIPKPLR